MAVRVPSAFVDVDVSLLVPRATVIFTEPDNVINNQQFAVDKSECLVSDAIPMFETTSLSYVEVGRYFFHADMAGVLDPITAYFCFRARTSAGNDFDVRVSETNRPSVLVVNVTADQTSEAWRGWHELTLYGDGTENQIRIDVKMASYSDTLAFFGFGLFR